jgi:parvulin-like peptidyl-prolyl isomerase
METLHAPHFCSEEHSMADRQKPVVHTKKHLARLARERRQTRMILIAFSVIMAAVLGLVGYAILDATYLRARRPVATVGEAKISTHTWQARVRFERLHLLNLYNQYQQYQQYFQMDLSSQLQQIVSQLDTPEDIGRTVLDQMIDEEIIRQEAAKRGITVSPEELETALQAQHQYYPNGTPSPTVTPTDVTLPTFSPGIYSIVTITPTASPAPTDTPDLTATVTPTLEATATETATETAPSPTAPAATELPTPTETPYTLEGYQTAYKESLDSLAKLGFTEQEYRSYVEAGLLREKLFAVITADVPREQDEIWSRHILTADEGSAIAARALLDGGKSFEEVAQQLSLDSSKDQGGDLGWHIRSYFVKEFSDAAFSLKVGEISQPVKSQFGYHIIQVLARRTIPLNADEYQQAKQAVFDEWLKSLHDQYTITTFDDWWTSQVPTEPKLTAQ